GADLVADVQGYFTSATSAAAGRLVSLTPARILDTRTASQVGYTGGKPGAGAVVPVRVTGVGGVPGSGVSAVALNMTATDATGPGFLTAWPSGLSRPLASNLNVTVANETRANAVWVPVGANGTVNVYVFAGADVVVDVDGYFTDDTATDSPAGLFVPAQPTRLLDTRGGTSQTGYQGGKPGIGATVPLQVTGRGPIGTVDVAAVVGNTTVTDTAASGFVTVWPAGVTRPLASNVNVTGVGDTAATLTTSPLGSGGGLDLYTLNGADLIFDVAGYFTADLTSAGPVTDHVSDQPAAGTHVFQAGQVTSITPGATSTTVVFGAGVTLPAVGASVVVQAGGAFTDGATGTITAVTANQDGTTTVTLTPVALDSLYDNMSIGYSGPADLELTSTGESGSIPHGTAASGSGGEFNFASAFSCDSSGVAVAVASLTFENTSVDAEVDLGLTTTPFVSFTMSTEPVVEFSGKISGQVTCTLTSAFQKAFRLKWTFLAAGVPITVTVAPTLTFTASAAGDFDVAEHFYRTIGFQTNPDLSLKMINNGAQHVTTANIGAKLQASLAFGAAISVKILDIAGVNVNVGPKFVATSTTRNSQTCTTLTAEIDGSVNAQLNLFFKKLTSRSVNGTLGPWTLYTSCPVDVTTTSLPTADTGQPYDTVLAATGGTGPLTWSLTGGSLPSGLTMSDQGEISGTPTVSGTSSFIVQATDTLGVSGTATLTLTVVSTAQCVFAGITTCDSTDPTAEVLFVSQGDTSACTFTSNIDWGDGSAVQVENFTGGPDGTRWPFDHTYTTPGTYTINLNDVVDSGNCTFGSGSVQFTLDPSSGAAARSGATTAPHRAAEPPVHSGGMPGIVIG
ncbi:MAG TPA: Ig domain-containing protein, partial [Pseudonocardiaceae bacterium]